MSNEDPAPSVVIVFDEGLPNVPPCVEGCETDERHICIHRFPAGACIVSHTKPLQSGLKDLFVLKYVLALAGKGFGGSTPGVTPIVLMSNDKRFWRSARHQYVSRNGHERMHIRFDDRLPGAVHASIRGRVIRVDVIASLGKRARQSGPAMLRWAAIQSHRYLKSLHPNRSR